MLLIGQPCKFCIHISLVERHGHFVAIEQMGSSWWTIMNSTRPRALEEAVELQTRILIVLSKHLKTMAMRTAKVRSIARILTLLNLAAKCLSWNEGRVNSNEHRKEGKPRKPSRMYSNSAIRD